MHLDLDVATLRGDGTCTIYSPSFMPYSLYLESAAKSSMYSELSSANSVIKKVVYRGLKKNENRLYALFAYANLYSLAIADRKLSTT